MNKDLDWVHHDSKTFDEEKFMENIERKYIKKHTSHIEGFTKDYVDKLLEENKNLKEWLNNVCFDGWNENVELALRYLLRIGYISFDEETREYINHNINDPICFGEERRKYNDLLDKLDLENQDYKSRIDKAIEYLPELRRSPSYELDERVDNLDYILQGSDKE